jgi:two-component system sensor histidine kinase VicK
MNECNDQLFCQMGEVSRDGYFIYDTELQAFHYLNASMGELCGFTITEINQNLALLMSIVHPEDREHAFSCFEECLADQLQKKYEIRLMVAGAEKYVMLSVFPIVQHESVWLCGIAEDFTAAKHNKIHIEQINAHKNITLEILSHDLKEPLGMMKLTASSMEKELQKIGNAEIMDSLVFIKEMCERNIKLVRSMINHEFLKSSIIELKKERVDIVWEINDVIRFYRRSHLRELKDFRFNSSDEKIYLFLDSMKFLQVINNLISNAIKFTIYKGIIEVGIKNQENTILVSISDNGIGIPDELKKNLFNRRESSMRPGLNGEESGGLGMSIVKSIVELHGGQIWFESEVGKGSTFFIELPK